MSMGSDESVLDYKGWSILHLAVGCGSLDTLGYLLQHCEG